MLRQMAMPMHTRPKAFPAVSGLHWPVQLGARRTLALCIKPDRGVLLGRGELSSVGCSPPLGTRGHASSVHEQGHRLELPTAPRVGLIESKLRSREQTILGAIAILLEPLLDVSVVQRPSAGLVHARSRLGQRQPGACTGACMTAPQKILQASLTTRLLEPPHLLQQHPTPPLPCASPDPYILPRPLPPYTSQPGSAEPRPHRRAGPQPAGRPEQPRHRGR